MGAVSADQAFPMVTRCTISSAPGVEIESEGIVIGVPSSWGLKTGHTSLQSCIGPNQKQNADLNPGLHPYVTHAAQFARDHEWGLSDFVSTIRKHVILCGRPICNIM